MAYRDNVTALATKLGISNDPGLREEDIAIATITFVDADANETPIRGTDMNRGRRLFFQGLTNEQGGIKTLILLPDEELLRNAIEYFAELWEPNPVPDKRKLLDALRDPRFVQIEILLKESACAW